jgi:hypothetical protein
MRYFRRKSQFVWLALLAVAGQVVLTLGHAHETQESGVRQFDFSLSGVTLEAGGYTIAAKDNADAHRDLPTGSNDLDESCVICWTIAQAGASILHSPASIYLTRLRLTVALPYRTVELISCGRTSQFGSRAPPVASQA